MIKGRKNIDVKSYKNHFTEVDITIKTYGKPSLKKTDVSIVFPMYENVELVKILLISLFEKQKNNKEKIEVVIVDNFSSNIAKKELHILLSEIEKKYKFDYQINLVEQSSKINYSIEGGYEDSIMNAYGLHIGIESINTKPEFIFVCHNDVMFVSKDWFSFLKEKIKIESYAMSGFRNYNREKDYAHVCGYMFKTKYFSKESLDFFPCYKEESIILDVGDKLSDECRKNNHNIFIAKNTFNKNVNEDHLSYPFNEYSFDRAINENNEVVFMHLGRGARKSLNLRIDSDRKKSFQSWKEIFKILF